MPDSSQASADPHGNPSGLGFRITAMAVPFAVATLVGASIGSLVQSHINLTLLWYMGAPLSPGAWARTVIHDLVVFMPLFGVLVGIAFLVGFPIALVGCWMRPRWRPYWLIGISLTALTITILVADSLVRIPTLIAATRHIPGFVAMLFSAGIGAWLFHRMEPWPNKINAKWWIIPALALPVAMIPGLYFFNRAMLPERGNPVSDADSFKYRVETLTNELVHPWGMAFLPDGRILVSERAGNLRIFDTSANVLSSPLKGVPEVYEAGQGGMLDVELSPNFEEDRYVFFTYSGGSADASSTHLARGELRGEELINTQILFKAYPKKPSSFQYGSRIEFLPDNTMLVSIGDGFDFREEAQNLHEHFGKVIRLDMDGQPPEDNPFFGEEDHLDEIYSYGHRNPQGLFYDEHTERVYLSDHGPYGGDELNIVEPGANYGWPVATYGVNYPGDIVSPYESLPGITDPVYHWIPSVAPAEVCVYRGKDFPELDGRLLMSALAGKGVFALTLEDDRVVKSERLFHELNKRIRLVNVGPDGLLYLLVDHDRGEILRIRPQS